MNVLANKVAIVTGASSGIGRATAMRFAREGAKLVVTARRQSELDILVSGIEAAGGQAIAIAGDVKDEALAKQVVEAAVGCFGGLDIAFNNAGMVGPVKPITEVSADEWQDTLHTNLSSAFFGAKHQLPAMTARGGGSLIFTSSFVGYTVGMPNMAAYAAAKAGQIGLVKAIASEYGAKGIRANAILPGGTDTPMSLTNAPGAGPEVQAFIESLHALKRMATPDEIAASALYLASDGASFITGTALLVDGGVSISRT